MKKFKVLKFIMIFLILLLLTASGLVYAYLKTDFMKTPDQLFKKYLLLGALEISSFNMNPYDEILDRAKNEKLEITSQREQEYTDTQSTSSYFSFGEEEVEAETETKKLLINEDLKFDMQNEDWSYLIDIDCEDEYFLDVNVLKTDDIFGVHIPEVHDKYLALENKDLKRIPERLGGDAKVIDVLPNEIPTAGFSEEELVIAKNLLSKYYQKISDAVDISLYTKEEYEMNYNGENVAGSKYVLTIPEDKIEEIAKSTFEELEKDQEFLDLIEGNVLGFYFKYIQAIKEFSESMAEGLMGNLENFENTTEVEKEEPKNVKISVYEYKGKTIKFDIINEAGSSTEFLITNKETSSNMSLKMIEPKTEDNEVGLESTVDISNMYENNNGEFLFKAKTTYNKDDIKAEKNTKNEEMPYMTGFYDDEYFAEKYSDTEIELSIKTTNKNDEYNSKFTYKSSTQDLNEKFEYKFKFDPNLEIPKLDEDKILIINEYSTEDFISLGAEITKNMYDSAEDKPNSLIGNIYKEKIEEEKAQIERYREYVYDDMKDAIEKLLNNYTTSLSFGEEVQFEDFLNLDNIKDKVGFMIDEVELIDGNTFKCTVNDYIYFVKINIDGTEFVLTDIQVLYSEDGTIENAI